MTFLFYDKHDSLVTVMYSEDEAEEFAQGNPDLEMVKVYDDEEKLYEMAVD